MPKTISLCMIIKNEEEFLENCLRWHQTLVDEIIIIDTGSSDRSKEIAKNFTNKVYDFKWCDDFSAARNFSLSFATGDWILVLDADEKLSLEDQNQIRHLVEKSNPEAYQFIQRTYTNNASLYSFKPLTHPLPFEAPLTLGFFDTYIVRLIPNQKELGLRYVQRIHEGIEYEDTSKKPLSTAFILHHFGQLKKEAQLQEKKNLYFHLEKIRKSENKNDAEGLRQYASACLEFEQWEEAIENFNQSLQLEPQHIYSFYGLALATYSLKQFDRCENYLRLALQRDANNFSFLRFLAVLLLEQQKEKEALDIYHHALKINPDDTEIRAQFVSRYMQQGKVEKSLELLKEIFKINPLHEDSLYNAGIIFKHFGKTELALEMMQKLQQLRPEDLVVQHKIKTWITESHS